MGCWYLLQGLSGKLVVEPTCRRSVGRIIPILSILTSLSVRSRTLIIVPYKRVFGEYMTVQISPAVAPPIQEVPGPESVGLGEEEFECQAIKLVVALKRARDTYRRAVVAVLTKYSVVLASMSKFQVRQLFDQHLQGFVTFNRLCKARLHGFGLIPVELVKNDGISASTWEGLPPKAKQTFVDNKEVTIETHGTVMRKPALELSAAATRIVVDASNPSRGILSPAEARKPRKASPKYLQPVQLSLHPGDPDKFVVEAVGLGHRAVVAFTEKQLKWMYRNYKKVKEGNDKKDFPA